MYEGYQEIKTESFWGAIAAIVFFQIVGYMIFQSFISYLEQPFMFVWGCIWLLVFMFFQSKMMREIRQFLSRKSPRSATLSLRQIDDWIKFFLTIIFSVILLLFILGYYPFPKTDYDIFKLALFFIFSLFVSSIFSAQYQKTVPETKSMKFSGSPLGGVFGGLFFVIFGYLIENYADDPTFNFYILGMPGMGFIMMCLTILLVEDQIK